MTLRKLLIAAVLFLIPSSVYSQSAELLIRQYQLQLIRSQNNALAWALLGYAFLQKARETGDPAWHDSARTALTCAYQVDSTDGRVNTYRAMSQAARHEFRQAIRSAQAALQAKPNDAHTFGLIGDAYLELGELDSMRRYYDRMESPGAPDVAALARRARLWGEVIGQTDSARACLERAFALAAAEKNREPENLAWLCVMQGEIELGEGNFSRADSFYQTALAYLPDYPLALEHTAEIQVIGKRFEKAIKLYRQAGALSGNPGLAILLGDAFEKAGWADSANFYWDKGEAGYLRLLESGNNGYLRPLAEFYLARGKNLQKALMLAKEDLTIRQDFGAYLTLGRAYLQMGKKRGALVAIAKAGSEAENDPQFCYYAGEIYLANGNRGKAKELFTKTHQLCPRFDLIFGTDLTAKLASLRKKVTAHN